MEEWRRRFRMHIVDVLGSLPPGGPDLRVVCDFAEAVGAEVGPRLRAAGWDDSDIPAELYATHRACYWLAVANEVSTRSALRARGAAPRGDDPLLERLAAGYPGEPLFREGIRRHAAMLPDEQASAVSYLDARAPVRFVFSVHAGPAGPAAPGIHRDARSRLGRHASFLLERARAAHAQARRLVQWCRQAAERARPAA
jgi:hypothetical protein